MEERARALEVDAEHLTASCDPEDLPFTTTEELHSMEAVFGQERATRAIEFALGMEAPGYNLYASGPDGIGKASILEAFLRRRAEAQPAPPDWIYVHNFDDPDRPLGISLPAGEGRTFAEALRRTVEQASQELQQAFESDSYVRQRADVGGGLEERRGQVLLRLQQRAEQLGFALQMTPQGIMTQPIVNGQPVADISGLPQAEQERIQQRAHEQLEPLVQDALLEIRSIEREVQEEFERLNEEVATFAVQHLFVPLLEHHQERPRVVAFLEAVRADVMKERDRLRGAQQGMPMFPGQPSAQQVREALWRRYEVNAAIANDPREGAPVVVETNPNYANLLGRVEYVGQFGTAVTDHTMIRPGSLALANGGYLMLRIRDLLQNPGSYEGLKRALHSGELAIENLQQALGLIPTAGLRPEPMTLTTKVVVVGDPLFYAYLFRMDPDFRELFRVKADFEVDFERTSENIVGLASVIHSQCDRTGMRCFTNAAVARLVEHSSRTVEDQRRLSANIGDLLDVVRQADYWAGQDGVEVVDARHVERALEEREFRSSLVRDRIQQLIDDGTIYLDTDGEKVGQINALSVYDLGDLSFGRPSRITCVTSAGRGTIVNVERETNMAGRTHNKGFLILRGFLADRFGQDKAMALHASMTFEQLYGDIDGDSASSTELYVLLSSLARVPIRQSIAVTGSLNQRGEVQPIGGATAKIEGFFDVCKVRGLDGTQGVMIPRSNIDNVVLRPEVAEAIAAGRFHVWAVSTIEEGIAVLTGLDAGEADPEGHYPPESVYGRVQTRLEEFAKPAQPGAVVLTEGAGRAPEPTPMPPPPGIPIPPPEPPIEF